MCNYASLTPFLTPFPTWFIPAIVLNEHQQVIILDDDESIHNVWRERFRQFMDMTNKTIRMGHFFSPSEFINWQNDQSEKNIHSSLFLCDYEFVDCSENGIDFITKLKINYLSVLVTSRFNSEEIISSCEEKGIKLLPKNMASIIPLKAKK